MNQSRRIAIVGLILWLSLLSPLAARSLIWQVDGPQGTVYLMGSIHWLKASDYPLDAAFDQAYRQSAKLYFEADLREMAKPAAGQQLLRRAQYPAGKSLKTAISPALYRQTQTAAKRLGLKPESLERYKPWFVGMLLTQTQLARSGYAPEHGIDNHFNQRAVADRKPIIGFETLDEQLAFLDGLPDQEGLLRMTLTELDLASSEINNLVGAFKRGDAAAVERFIKVQDLSGFEATILNQRSQAWLPKIEAQLKRPGTTLVIVGAGHLVGERGLVRLLEARGYQVRQL
jgi:hypothetical protein